MKTNNFVVITVAAAFAVLSGLLPVTAYAQVGGDNPSGTAGQFNGNVTTGCSYDPYTGNATRSITDIVVAGGVGEYPLAFSRTMTSRYVAGLPTEFGAAGSWRHSYQWSIDTAEFSNGTLPTKYDVNYPDGRRITFSSHPNVDTTWFRGLAGVRDRFQQLQSGTTECYVRLPDGGKIHFHTDTAPGTAGKTKYTYSFREIIDPYGQITTISYPVDQSMTITEPAGRMFKIFYVIGPAGDKVVTRVEAWLNGQKIQSVYYYYVLRSASGTNYSALDHINYPDGTSAIYTYQNSNVTTDTRPLISTCTDPMFDGPMWKIAYEFAPAGTNPDGSTVVYGQLRREKHPGGTVVSSLMITGAKTRAETRGDNPVGGGTPTRTFTYYSGDYKLKSVTDFKGLAASQTYDGTNGYLTSVTDRRGNKTDYISKNLNGNIAEIDYPISNDVLPNGAQTTVKYNYGNSGCFDPNNQNENVPCYLCTEVSNNALVHKYKRDTLMRVKEITYLDNNNESFTYNSQFGQVETHTLRNTGVETYHYNNLGQLTDYWDAEHPMGGTPTARYQYDALGRVSGITECRGSSSGDSNYTTNFEYNARGQLTKLTHPPDASGTRSYIQYKYNTDGTLQWTADERHPNAASDATQRTSYAYDDYKRLRTVTTPLRAANDSTPRTTTYFYDQNGTGEDYTRTAAIPTKVVSPGNKVVKTSYDENLRTLSVTAVGDPNVADAKTSYTYDANGNVLTVKDPNGQTSGAITQYSYDKQNRVAHIDDPISTDRNSNGHTMDYFYDVGGNVRRETRADDLSCVYYYDSSGRLQTRDGYAGEHTEWLYDEHGDIPYRYGISVGGNRYIDYFYTHDHLDRLISTQYVADSSGTVRYEKWHYDLANHLDKYTNPANQEKTFTCDKRGRLTNTSWNANGPAVTIAYDAASRPQSITSTAYSAGGVSLPATTIAFGYDEANNRTFEDQTVGSVTRRIQTDPDADGNRKNLLVKNGGTTNFATNFDYTSRNELLNIKDSNQNPFFKYTYDASGNVTQRLTQTLAGDSTTLQYDAMNRPIQCNQSRPGNANFAISHYQYSKLGNLGNTTRDEEGGKGDYFDYDGINQLKTALYSATSLTDANPAKKATYTYNYGRRDRATMTVIDNLAQTTTNTTYSWTNSSTGFTNNLNQYTTITANGVVKPLTYDSNFNLNSYNGWTYIYDAENRLVSVSGGHSAQFAYDAVGRCVRRQIDGTTNALTRIYTYDQWTPVAEWDGGGNLIVTNVFGLGDDEILYRTNSNGSTKLYFKSDPMGNVKFVTDGSGGGLEKYTYDAFGQPRITNWDGSGARTNSNYLASRFMFSGREFFSELGLYDMRNRVYDPVMAHFYQMDPIGFQGDPLNEYRFSGNNPLLGGDPMGLQDTNPDTASGESDTTYWNRPISFTISLSDSGLTSSSYSLATEAFFSEVFGEDTASNSYGNTLFYTLGSPTGLFDLVSSGFPGFAFAAPRSVVHKSVSQLQSFEMRASAKVTIDTHPMFVLPSLKTPIPLTYEGLYAELMSTKHYVRSKNVATMDAGEFVEFMRRLNTRFWNPHRYSSPSGAPGVFHGHSISYFGIGMGSAARGWNRLQMYSSIVGFRSFQSGTFYGGEFEWADLGYNAYLDDSEP